jgi:predicted DNA-binding WGR domain protein
MPASPTPLETRLIEMADACATDPKHRGVLSTSEQLTVGIILNREDRLREWNYSKQEAVDRIGSQAPQEACAMVFLTRTDTGQNMRRFYSLNIMPTILGTVDVVSEWGRVGSPGQVRIRECASDAEAAHEMQRTMAAKIKRGYVRLT